MSVFYCDWCDNLIDSDEAPDFYYHEVSDMWQCENCVEIEDEVLVLGNNFIEIDISKEGEHEEEGGEEK